MANKLTLNVVKTEIMMVCSRQRLVTHTKNFDLTRDVPDPDTGIRYPVKYRHPALSGIW